MSRENREISGKVPLIWECKRYKNQFELLIFFRRVSPCGLPNNGKGQALTLGIELGKGHEITPQIYFSRALIEDFMRPNKRAEELVNLNRENLEQ